MTTNPTREIGRRATLPPIPASDPLIIREKTDSEPALTVAAPASLTLTYWRERAAVLLPETASDADVMTAAHALAALYSEPTGANASDMLATLAATGAMTADDVAALAPIVDELVPTDVGDRALYKVPSVDRSITPNRARGFHDEHRARVITGTSDGMLSDRYTVHTIGSAIDLADYWQHTRNVELPDLVGTDAYSWEQTIAVGDDLADKVRENMGASIGGRADYSNGTRKVARLTRPTRRQSLAGRTGPVVPCTRRDCTRTGPHGHRTGPTVAQTLTVTETLGIGAAAIRISRLPARFAIPRPVAPDRTRSDVVTFRWDVTAGRWVAVRAAGARVRVAKRGRAASGSDVDVRDVAAADWRTLCESVTESASWSDGTARVRLTRKPDRDGLATWAATIQHGTGKTAQRTSRTLSRGDWHVIGQTLARMATRAAARVAD